MGGEDTTGAVVGLIPTVLALGIVKSMVDKQGKKPNSVMAKHKEKASKFVHI